MLSPARLIKHSKPMQNINCKKRHLNGPAASSVGTFAGFGVQSVQRLRGAPAAPGTDDDIPEVF